LAKKLIVLGKDGKLALRAHDGTTQAIPKSLGAWALLLLDCSSSMSDSKIDQAKAGARSFANQAGKKGYSVGLIRFATEANVVCDLGQEISILTSAVERLEASGSTNMADAIALATERITGLNGSRVIVLVSDGEPDNRDATIKAALSAKNSGIDIITIAVDHADTEFLKLIATRSDLAAQVPATEIQSGIAGAARMLPSVTRFR
jgi:Ca-activated chloride channel family protein